MFKLALNAGHGINTAGKRCLKSIDPNETREWQLNSRICNKIEDKLKAYDGYTLIRLDDTTGQTDIPLKTRTTKANEFGADFYLAIHHNAGVNGASGGGVISIVYKTIQDGSTTQLWQKALYDRIINYTGLKGNRSTPLQKQDLHEVRESNMPAVLLECGFMDSTTDVPVILTEEYADRVAAACVEVIAERGGLTKKAPQEKLTGHLDGVTEGDKYTVYGWAYNGINDNPVEVHIYFYKADGGAADARPGIMANKYRADLVNAKIGNGYHGFEAEFDLSAICPGKTVTAKAYAIGQVNKELTGNIKFAVKNPPEPVKEEPIIEPVIESPAAPPDPIVEQPTESVTDTTPETPAESNLQSDDIEVKSGIVKLIYQILQSVIKWLNK